MAKKNELPALIAALVFTVALLGGGVWWLRGQFFGDGLTLPELGQSEDDNSAESRASGAGRINLAGADGTSGESILPGSSSASKQAGLEALAAGDFVGAQQAFTAALQENRNDPETLIYLNNAKIGEAQAYTVAVSVPAGSVVNPAQEILRGVAQAQLELNQSGGANGVPLKVLVLDDNGEPEQAKAIASALVDDPDVLGVIGHFSSDMTLVAAEVYQAGGLTMISPTSTAVKIAEVGDYVFRTVPSDRLASATLSRYVSNTLDKQKVAVFYTSESAYSQSVKSEFTTELLSSGGQVVTEVDISQPGFSAGRAVQAAKESGAEVLMLALTVASADTSSQIIAVNQRSLPIVGSDGLYNPQVLDVGRQNALDLVVAVPWHILSDEQSPICHRVAAAMGRRCQLANRDGLRCHPDAGGGHCPESYS